MKLLHSDGDVHQIVINAHELAILCNSLNEICHGIDVFEFSTRLGAGRDEVKTLLDQLSDIG